MSREFIFRSHPGIGPVVEGEALVSQHGFSARYDMNRDTGVISRETHDLYGQSIVDKICFFTTAKGGVCPKALIFGTTNPIMVQGAVLADLALMDRLEPDPFAIVETGDHVRVEPAAGRVVVTKQRADSPF
jgi:predicted aconitase with swiveling domain